MGYLVVTAVLVVTFGRLGDMFGRVRMYNAGLRASSASRRSRCRCARGPAAQGALWLIGFRVVQGIGGALLIANSAAILTDAFPAKRARARDRHQHDRGHRRLVHRPGRRRPARRRRLARWSSGSTCPIGVFGTVWAYLKLREVGVAHEGHASTGGATSRSRVGLVLVLIGITYGIQPARRPHDGLDRPVGARSSSSAASRCSSLFVLHRDAASTTRCSTSSCSGSARSRPGNIASLLVVDRARRPAVHAHHLAAGHLAAAARLQLRATRRCGPASTCSR